MVWLRKRRMGPGAMEEVVDLVMIYWIVGFGGCFFDRFWNEVCMSSEEG